MGKASRDKGKRGELEAAKLWRRWFPDCKRRFGQARYGGSEAPDIGSTEMNKHYYVEVKRYKKITDGMVKRLYRATLVDWCLWADQNIDDNVPHPLPFLMFREDNSAWNVVFDPDELDYETRALVVSFADDMGDNVYVVDWRDFAAALDKIRR